MFPQTRPFCRVSYIGFTLVRASIALHETWSTLKRFRYFIQEAPKSGVRTNKALLRMFDTQQTIKIGM